MRLDPNSRHPVKPRCWRQRVGGRTRPSERAVSDGIDGQWAGGALRSPNTARGRDLVGPGGARVVGRHKEAVLQEHVWPSRTLEDRSGNTADTFVLPTRRRKSGSLVVEDSTLDPLVCDNLAIPDLNVRAYLGVPLLDQDGHVLGSLCAIDAQPRKWTTREQEILADFAKLVEEQILLRDRVARLAQFDEQRLLIQGELAHRIKNIFSVISSLLLVSSRTETDLDGFVRSVTGRIQALSRANDFIIDSRPDGNGDARGLSGLMEALLAPFKRDERQVIVTCSNISVGEKTAAALALVVHELATNAAKYGALSTVDGYIHLECGSFGDMLRITWREIGGPPIAQNPSRKGFGTRMVGRTVEAQLMGKITRDFASDGLVVGLEIPLSVIAR